MTLEETMKELASQASASTKKTYMRHGAQEPLFGVPIGKLKPIHQKIKGDQELALKLYASGNGDAMYLAGMVADGRKMTRAQLDRWVKDAIWPMISGTTVPWVTAEHPDAIAIAMKWIDSPKEHVAVAGWSTLAAVVTTTPDDRLPIKDIAALLDRVVKMLKTSANRVRYVMNSFVMACGTYVAPLGDKALEAARQIGRVEVDMGDTSCQVPDAASYIIKSRRGAAIAPKRKTTRC
jgi:3-methyladenine DNA glycosylase AlkD